MQKIELVCMLQLLVPKINGIHIIQKTCKVYCMQKYIFKKSGLDFVRKNNLIFYLKIMKNTTLILKTGVKIQQV